MTDRPEPLQTLIDVAEEEDEAIIQCFRKMSKENDVFLSIIAPYVGAKVTPSKQITASIGFSEEFGVETVIERIKKVVPKPNTLYLLINSFGGAVGSSYKVARALRRNFKHIIVFVPHIAASGGTLIALTGNEIVMGMMSQITPLDPQIGKTSAASVTRGFFNIDYFFKTTSEEDAPYTYKALANKYDAVMLDEAYSNLNLMNKYVREILEYAGYPKPVCGFIAKKMVEGFYTHEDVIHFDEAKSIGLKVVPNTQYLELWETFRALLGKYLLKGASKHIIRYWIHTTQSKEGVQRDEKKES